MGPPSLVILFTVIVLLYMVYRWLRLPPFPVGRCRQFVERSRAGPIAHRAGRPENTLAGIRRAEQEGAPGVEVDLAFTKDSVAVLLHDKTVDRTSNGFGKLSELTFEEVRKLNFGNDSTSESIPTLEEALRLCEELDLQVYLEVKRGHDKAVAAIADCLRRSPALYRLVVVVSFCPLALYKMRAADPNINCGMILIGTKFVLQSKGFQESLWTATFALCCDWTLRWCVKNWLLGFLGVNMLLPQKEMVLNNGLGSGSYWEGRGVSLVTWTVNKREEKKIMKSELKIAFLSDSVNPDLTAPEQFELHKH